MNNVNIWKKKRLCDQANKEVLPKIIHALVEEIDGGKEANTEDSTLTRSIFNKENFNALNNFEQKQQLPPPQQQMVAKVRAQTEKRPNFSLRFDGANDHDKIKATKRQRCKLEECGRLCSTACSKCNVHLCQGARDCFTKFHNLQID